MKDTVTLFKIVFNFLDNCNENDLSALCEGTAKLKIDFPKDKISAQKDIEDLKNISFLYSQLITAFSTLQFEIVAFNAKPATAPTK